MLNLKSVVIQLLLCLVMISCTGSAQEHMPTANVNLIQLSQDFLYAARAGGDAQPYIDTLAGIILQNMQAQLKTDNDKKAFYINLYNAYTQSILRQNPDLYKNRGKFYKKKQIVLADNKISLDKLEHGLLRRSRVKLSLGYWGKMFPGKFEKALRVDTIDYRIHFALNCGAKSCPAIAYYKPEELHEQLELATATYLNNETEYDATNNVLTVPALMSWFRADFGGKKGILNIVKALKIIPETANPKLKYKKYDWSLYLDNFKTE